MEALAIHPSDSHIHAGVLGSSALVAAFASFQTHMNTAFDTPAVLLVGGMGTRLRSLLPSTPKPLASVGDKSFLHLLLQQLRNQGVSRVVMCTGYRADQIENEFGDGRDWNLKIEYSRELQPMGTAGAIKLAQKHFQHANEILVMNGDSFVDVDLAELLQFHRANHALITLAAVQVENASRYGTLCLDPKNRVLAFLEKTGSDVPGLINAGVYVFDQSVLDQIPEEPSSLEKDIFSRLIEKGIYALPKRGVFIDIGTPEDYARAQTLCEQLYAAAIAPSISEGTPTVAK